jgi:polysaccharide biosynthesis protein PslH
MKILLLTNKSPWPPRDGGSSATLSMIRVLTGMGASVTLLSFNTFKHHVEIETIPDEIKDYHFVNIDTRLKPMGLLFNLFFSCIPYTISRFRSVDLTEKLISLLKDEFDIVQIEGLSMAIYLPVIRKNSVAKVIFRPHNVENVIWAQLAKEESDIFRRLYFTINSVKTSRLERKIADCFDGVAAITEKDKEWFVSEGCRKPIIVSRPSPLKNDSISVKNIPMSVGFIGALDWRPNINGLKWLVKKVWPAVTEALPDATLFVAGRNPAKEINKICNGKNIIFIGETESSAEFIASREILVVPLFSGSGIRMKILEGMSLGKCIVATPASAEGIIFENKKDIFIEQDALLFADRITMLLRDANLRKITGANAQENVRKNYNTLAAAEDLMNFYTLFTR